MDRVRFIKLVSFLDTNYLGWCNYKDNLLIYHYRDYIYMADRQTDLQRYVVYAKSEQEINLNQYKILDKAKNLYLLASKDANIWESKD